MIEIPVEILPIIIPLLEEAVKVYVFPGSGFDLDHTMNQIHQGIASGKATVIVDNVALPRAFVIAVSEPSATWKGSMCVIPLLYVRPDFRSPGLFRDLMNAVGRFAVRKECQSILTSSWVYRGLTQSTAELWESLGFEAQETIYMRKI